jgi:N-methylhydantoinase A
LAVDAAKGLAAEKVPASEMVFGYQVDVRYHGQGLRLTVDVDVQRLEKEGLAAISGPFDAEHTRLFTFALPLEHEFVALRAVVQGKGVNIKRQAIAKGGSNAAAAAVGRQKSYMDGKDCVAVVYDRALLKAGNRIAGPAIVMEMDSTTVILPRHHGKVDAYGNILIYPDDYQAPKKKAGAARPRAAVAKVKRAAGKTARKAK